MSATDTKKQRLVLGICAFLVVSTVALYWPVNSFDFFVLDDLEFVAGNPSVNTGLSWSNTAWAFTSAHEGNWQPLTWLSHMLDCELFGIEDPGPHHLSNLFFHVVNALLLFLLLEKMTNKTWRSGFVAAVFALHPLHIESVAWVSERKDVLSAFFWLLTVHAYISYTARPGKGRYAAVLVLYIFGLMAKPMVVTLPFVLLILDFWPLRRFGIVKGKAAVSLVMEKLPLIVLAAALGAATIMVQQKEGLINPEGSLPLGIRAGNAFITYLVYIWKTIWPSGLSFYYLLRPEDVSVWKAAGSFSAILLITAAALFYTKRSGFFVAGWLWYLLSLIPVIGMIQLVNQARADRYTYIPLVGILVVTAWGVPALVAGLRFQRVFLGACMIAIIPALALSSSEQLPHWKNSESVCRRMIELDPDHHWAHNCLGRVLKENNRIEEAEEHFRKAIAIRPGYAKPYNHLGIISAERNELDKAAEYFRKAAERKPDYIEAWRNLGAAYACIGDPAAAYSCFCKAIELDPSNAGLRADLEKVMIQGKGPAQVQPEDAEK